MSSAQRFSSNLQICKCNCFLDIFIWMSPRHIKLTICKIKLSFPQEKLLPTFMSQKMRLISTYLLKSETWELSLTPSFPSAPPHPIHQQIQLLLCLKCISNLSSGPAPCNNILTAITFSTPTCFIHSLHKSQSNL